MAINQVAFIWLAHRFTRVAIAAPLAQWRFGRSRIPRNTSAQPEAASSSLAGRSQLLQLSAHGCCFLLGGVKGGAASLPSPRLQQMRLIERGHSQPLHRSRQILADFK